MIRSLVFFLLFCIVAEGAFHRIQFRDLRGEGIGPELLAGKLRGRYWTSRMGQQSGLPISRFAEFSFVVPTIEDDHEARVEGNVGDAWLIIDLDQGQEAKGFLDVWDSEKERWQSVTCQLDPEKLVTCSEIEVESVREIHARHQLSVNARGGIWYRSLTRNGEGNRREFEFDRTFTTLSGGRALAENLALDRDLILGAGEGEGEVELTSIKGVTVKPIPWNERLPEGEIAVDALSKRVPEDQYFMVVPSLQQLFGLMDRVEEAGTPILQTFSVGDDYRELPSRYRRQLGLDLPDVLARLLPVKSVAVTGGDPFFPTGSDVAVIFETDKVDFVFSSLQTAVSTKAAGAGAVAIEGEGVVAFENDTRSFSCHLAKLEGAVVVTNSAWQLAQIKAVAAGDVHALGETDEYRFFRNRYPIDADESAYVFISDACLRRWAGPAVRIGASRRSRAMAALGKLTSKQILGDELRQEYQSLLGKVSLSGDKVLSKNYGSMGFLTPVSELDFERVTLREEDAYERWRRGYEGGWAKFFDPIALRLNLAEEREELEMTILPLRVDSDYQEIISLVGDVRLSKAATTVPRESVFHFAMSVDEKSDLFQQAGVSLVQILPSLKVNPLGWMGSSLSVTLGESLAWQGGLGESALRDLPILLRVEVESRLKLALFMTGLKGAIESSSPDLVSWETREYEGRRYVAIIGDENELGMDLSIFYAALPSALLVTLNEDMLKRALDDEEELEEGEAKAAQVFAKTSPDFLIGLTGIGNNGGLEMRRRALSWSALPILNEWRKGHSAQDPVDFHDDHFATRITCPGGLGYRWNEEDLTMESVAFGHPSHPQNDAKPLEILKRFKSLETEALFEEGGLRLRMALDQESDFQRPIPQSAPRPEDDEVVKTRDLLGLPVGTVSIYESRSGDDPEEGMEKYETKVESAKTQGELLVIERSYRSTRDEVVKAGRVQTEFGPRGMRNLSSSGDVEMIPDPEGFGYPAELWPGLVFEVRKSDVVIRDGIPEKIPMFEKVTVLGWEKIKGPYGEELEALKLERQRMALAGPGVMRSNILEWNVKGFGFVKSATSSRWENSSSRLVEIRRPE